MAKPDELVAAALFTDQDLADEAWGRLVEADITTFAELVDAGVSAVSEAAGVSESTAVSWMEQADNLS